MNTSEKPEIQERTDILNNVFSSIMETKEMLTGLRTAAFDMAEFQGSNASRSLNERFLIEATWAEQYYSIMLSVLISTIKTLSDIEKALEPLT